MSWTKEDYQKAGGYAERRRLIMMRQAKSSTGDKYGAGGLPKKGGYVPKAVTLPKLKFQEPSE